MLELPTIRYLCSTYVTKGGPTKALVHQDALKNKVIVLKASYQIKIQSF